MPTLITGNTYPVKDKIKNLGGKWDATNKGWLVPDDKAEEAKKLVFSIPVQPKRNFTNYHPSHCKECGCNSSQYNPIYRSGVCKDCWLSEKEEREMGY